MSNLSVKRQRASINGDSAAVSESPDEYRKIIATFDESTLRDLLLFAATNSSQVAAQVIALRNDIFDAESRRVIDFDRFSKSLWHDLAQGDGSTGSRQYHLGLEVSVRIEETIARIKEQTLSHSSFGTKKSALVTLRKIAKIIVLSGNNTMGHEVIIQLCQDGEPLDKAMHYIVDGMSEHERDIMRSDQEWVDRVKELVELGRKHQMYETLIQLLEKLGVGVVDGRVQKVEIGIDTVERTAPVEEARKSKKAKAPRRDMCGACGCGNPLCLVRISGAPIGS